MPGQPKKKNNHYVPQSYLRRFRSISDRQVALFNIKSGRVVESAPIKSQCARDYFYTKNPAFNQFSILEGHQNPLFEKIIKEKYVPSFGTDDRHSLLSLIMFQAGRTATAAAQQDHLANEFGKAILRKHLEQDDPHNLLSHLPQLKISVPYGVIDAIGQHLVMYPLIGDLDITLFVNQSREDFLTSDHPVSLCNNLPASSPHGANTGFSSRGLILMFPLSPRTLLFLSDPEVYKVAKDIQGISTVRENRDVIDLNLPQCFNAYENLYFSSLNRVEGTTTAFRKKAETLRAPRPALTETAAISPEGRKAVLFQMPAPLRRMSLPNAVEIRYAARKGKYARGDAFIRDPIRTAAVRTELERLQRLREAATTTAEVTE